MIELIPKIAEIGRNEAIFTPSNGRDAEIGNTLTIVESNPIYSFKFAAQFSVLMKESEQEKMLKLGGIHSMYQFFYDKPNIFTAISPEKVDLFLQNMWVLFATCVVNPYEEFDSRNKPKPFDAYFFERHYTSPDTLYELFKDILNLHTAWYDNPLAHPA